MTADNVCNPIVAGIIIVLFTAWEVNAHGSSQTKGARGKRVVQRIAER